MEVKYQVFVSSTFEDLQEERKEVCQAVLESHCIPAGMELFPASNKSQWDFIKRVIDESDFYLIIIAGKYGSIGINDEGKKVSYTEMEFDYALNQKKPIIALVYDNVNNLPMSKVETTQKRNNQLEQFRKKVYSGRIIKKWNNKDDLRACVLAALSSLKEETNAPGWIRADFTIDKLSYDYLEKQRKKYEEIISSKNNDYNILLSNLKEKEKEIERILSSNKAKVRTLYDKIAQLTDQLKNTNVVVIEKEFLLIKIVELNFSYDKIEKHDLIADLSNQFDIQCDMRFFLSNYCNTSFWEDVTQNSKKMLLKFKDMDSKKKIAFLKNISFEEFVFSDDFDAYCIENSKLSNLFLYMFFLVSLNRTNCENYIRELIKSKTTQVLYICNKLIDEIWESEICLSENDT